MPRHALDFFELDGKTAAAAEEFRRNPAVRDALIAYAEARILRAHEQLCAGLLNERESDMLRGRIAELKNLINDVQSTGEEHGLG